MLSSQSKNPLDYLDGMPPYLMMQMEERLERRIAETIREFGKVVDEDRFVGWRWRSLWSMDSDEHARHILRRMMEQRINDGRQFDSILECSRRAFATSMMMSAIERSGEAQPNEPRN
jgi:hypothetical protein